MKAVRENLTFIAKAKAKNNSHVFCLIFQDYFFSINFIQLTNE